MPAKVESEGKLRFYDPAQLGALKRHAPSPVDAAIFTLAAEAGPRLSEIRALKVRNVDFANSVVRFEDGSHEEGRTCGERGPAGPLGADERQRSRGAAAALPGPRRRGARVRARGQARSADLRHLALPALSDRGRTGGSANPEVPRPQAYAESA
jgi:integrase